MLISSFFFYLIFGQPIRIDERGINQSSRVHGHAARSDKLGGGFYCGDIEHDGMRACIFYAFFMDMRVGHVKLGKFILYYVAQWDPN